MISSIHSFTQSSIGAWFLGFIAVVVAASIALILVPPAAAPLARRGSSRSSRARRPSSTTTSSSSRFALTVLWGVVYPLVSEAVRGVRGDRRRAVLRLLRHRLRAPARAPHGNRPARRLAAGLASRARRARSSGRPARRSSPGSLLLLAGAGSSPAGLVGYTFAAFVLAAIVLEFARGTRARHVARRRGLWLGAFTGLVGRNRRRYGGYVVHAAIVLLLVGAVGIGGFGTTQEGEARAGPVGAGRRLRRSPTWAASSSARRTRVELRARLDVSRGGKELGHRLGRQEPLSRRAADLERGRDSLRLAAGRRPLRHRRPVQRRRLRLRQGARQPARQPHLARRARLRARLAHHACGPTRASNGGSRAGSPYARRA